MHTRTWSALPSAVLLAGFCTACGSLATDGAPARPSWGDLARPAAAVHGEADELMQFLARAEPGAAGVVSSPDAGGMVQVSVERDYYAASGRPCRRLVVIAGDDRPIPRVACRDGVGIWRLLPPLRNRGLAAVAQQAAPGAGPAP